MDESILVTPDDRDRRTVEFWHDDVMWGELVFDGDELLLEVLVGRGNDRTCIPLETVLTTLAAARDRLLMIYPEINPKLSNE